MGKVVSQRHFVGKWTTDPGEQFLISGFPAILIFQSGTLFGVLAKTLLCTGLILPTKAFSLQKCPRGVSIYGRLQTKLSEMWWDSFVHKPEAMIFREMKLDEDFVYWLVASFGILQTLDSGFNFWNLNYFFNSRICSWGSKIGPVCQSALWWLNHWKYGLEIWRGDVLLPYLVKVHLLTKFRVRPLISLAHRRTERWVWFYYVNHWRGR